MFSADFICRVCVANFYNCVSMLYCGNMRKSTRKLATLFYAPILLVDFFTEEKP